MGNKTNCIVTLTPAAIAHIEQVMERNSHALGFRLSMKKYGCNGYGYVPEVIDSMDVHDIELTTVTAFRFFVDSRYAADLDGTVVDYVEKSLGQQQMVFRNPNAEGECGCGESVNLVSRKNE